MSLKDASCSGAETAEMTTPQSTYAGTNPPQLNSIAADTRIVSLQIGGNDIGFTEILTECQTANPFGRPCQDKYVRGGSRRAAQPDRGDRAEGRGAVLAGIKARTTAKILILNYEALLPSSGSGCWPQVPIAWADVPYVRGIQLELNKMIASEASKAGAKLVDTYTVSLGKDACKGSGTRWVEPLVPGNAAAPFHPNARGMAGVTPAVVAAAGGARSAELRRRSAHALARELGTVDVPALAALAVGGAHVAVVQVLAVDGARAADQPGAVGALGVGGRRTSAPSEVVRLSARTPPASSIAANAVCGSPWNLMQTHVVLLRLRPLARERLDGGAGGIRRW